MKQAFGKPSFDVFFADYNTPNNLLMVV